MRYKIFDYLIVYWHREESRPEEGRKRDRSTTDITPCVRPVTDRSLNIYQENESISLFLRKNICKSRKKNGKFVSHKKQKNRRTEKMITSDMKIIDLFDYLHGGNTTSVDIAADYGVEVNDDYERILKDAQDNYNDAMKIKDYDKVDEKLYELVEQFVNAITQQLRKQV